MDTRSTRRWALYCRNTCGRNLKQRRKNKELGWVFLCSRGKLYPALEVRKILHMENKEYREENEELRKIIEKQDQDLEEMKNQMKELYEMIIAMLK